MSQDDDSQKPVKAKKPNPYKRTQARRRALQALYQWDMTGESTSAIDAQFREGQDMKKVDLEYFSELLSAVSKQVGELDELVAPFMKIPLVECDPIERNILRLSTYELRSRLDIPARVVINEAVELAKAFGAEGGHKFINGVIDKLSKQARQHES